MSEGALTFYLSEKLTERKTRFRLGVEVAIDWDPLDDEETDKREVFFGSGGTELIKGKFGTLVESVSQSSLLTLDSSLTSLNSMCRESFLEPTNLSTSRTICAIDSVRTNLP